MFVSEDSRENGQNEPRSTDGTQIVARSKTPMAVGGGIFAPEGHGLMPDTQAVDSTKRGVSLSAILRYKWTIFLVAVLVAAPLIACVWMLVVPEYNARAEIRVRPRIPYLLFRIPDNGATSAYGPFVNTQSSLMRSPKVLQRVLDKPKVQQTEWCKDPPKSLLKSQTPGLMERLRNGLSVRPRRGTELIDVSFTARRNTDAEVIVNAALDSYIAYVEETSSSKQNDTYRQLADLFKSLEKEIDGRKTVLARLRQELGTSVPEELVSRKKIRLDEAEAAYRVVCIEIATAEWRLGRLEKEIKEIKGRDKGDSGKTEPSNVSATQPAMQQPKYRQDVEWRRMDMRVKTLEHQMESAKRDFKSGHPTMVRLASDLKFAEEMLVLRQEHLDEDWQSRVESPQGRPGATSQGPEAVYEAELRSIKGELEFLKYRSGMLSEEAKKQRSQFAETFKAAEMLEKENEAKARKERVFAVVRTRLEAMDVEQRNVVGSIEVLTRAMTSSKPSSDRRIVFTAMALVAGLGLGLGLAFLRASGNQVMYTPDDLPVHAVQGPFLGQLPLVAKTRKTAVEDDPMLAEGIRMVRTALVSRIREDCGIAILVSSAHTGAGKSTFAVMLARSLALSGKKTLLIDSDLRKRGLTARFNLADEPGFIESLQHRSVDKRSVFSTETPDLSFMPSGQRNGGIELELTANGAFEALIDQARSQYDIIILDSPPILPVADASILSRQVDGTVLIVRQETCQRAAVVDALASLGSAGGKLLGTVFLTSRQNALYNSSYYSYGDTR